MATAGPVAQEAVTGSASSYDHSRTLEDVSGNNTTTYSILNRTLYIPDNYKVDQTEHETKLSLDDKQVFKLTQETISSNIISMQDVNIILNETVSSDDIITIMPPVVKKNAVYITAILKDKALSVIGYKGTGDIIYFEGFGDYSVEDYSSILQSLFTDASSTLNSLPATYKSLQPNWYYNCPEDIKAGEYIIRSLSDTPCVVSVYDDTGLEYYSTKICLNNQYYINQCEIQIFDSYKLRVGLQCALVPKNDKE